MGALMKVITPENFYIEQRLDGTTHACRVLINRLLEDNLTLAKVGPDHAMYADQVLMLEQITTLLEKMGDEIYAPLYERRKEPSSD